MLERSAQRRHPPHPKSLSPLKKGGEGLSYFSLSILGGGEGLSYFSLSALQGGEGRGEVGGAAIKAVSGLVAAPMRDLAA